MDDEERERRIREALDLPVEFGPDGRRLPVPQGRADSPDRPARE